MSFQHPNKVELEVDIEEQGTEYAERRGWLCQKLQSLTAGGWPDRTYLRRGRWVLVEWKKPGTGRVSAQQAKRHREIRQHGGEVHVFDNLEDFKAVMK